ncbi:response regulator transcription factor [Adlercreutzia sp. ZJ141]|uniref:response regulator transcription factor n=1 Tax=Adlercreutzia sp. ZJ141 TaxID=2709406 RepID=UPI0013E9AC35|nr:helix-turn-helix transcriptional regulator [Adlercreutzia sp. ZJ141]
MTPISLSHTLSVRSIWLLGFSFQVLWQGLIVRQNNVGYGPVDIHLLFYSLFGVFSLFVAIIFLWVKLNRSYGVVFVLSAVGIISEFIGSLMPLFAETFSYNEMAYVGTVFSAIGSVACFLSWGFLFSRIPFRESVLCILFSYGTNFVLFTWIYMVFPVVPALILSLLVFCSSACLIGSIITISKLDQNGDLVSQREDTEEKLVGSVESQCTGNYYFVRVLAAFAIYSFVLTLRSPMDMTNSPGSILFNLLINSIALIFTVWMFWRIMMSQVTIMPERILQLLFVVFAVGFFIYPYVPENISYIPSTLLFVGTVLIFMVSLTMAVGITHSVHFHPLAIIGIWGACYGCPRFLYYVLSFAFPSIFGEGNNMAIAFIALFCLLISIFLLSPNQKTYSQSLQPIRPSSATQDTTLSKEARLHGIIKEYELTERESEVLQLALDGHTRHYIADKLYISENTVKAHLKRIYAKLGVHSKYDLENMLSKH